LSETSSKASRWRRNLSVRPVFGEFDGGAAEVAVILLEFRLETAEEGEGVGGGTGESSENFVLIEAANFLGSVLDYGFRQA